MEHRVPLLDGCSPGSTADVGAGERGDAVEGAQERDAASTNDTATAGSTCPRSGRGRAPGPARPERLPGGLAPIGNGDSVPPVGASTTAWPRAPVPPVTTIPARGDHRAFALRPRSCDRPDAVWAVGRPRGRQPGSAPCSPKPARWSTTLVNPADCRTWRGLERASAGLAARAPASRPCRSASRPRRSPGSPPCPRVRRGRRGCCRPPRGGRPRTPESTGRRRRRIPRCRSGPWRPAGHPTDRHEHLRGVL